MSFSIFSMRSRIFSTIPPTVLAMPVFWLSSDESTIVPGTRPSSVALKQYWDLWGNDSILYSYRTTRLPPTAATTDAAMRPTRKVILLAGTAVAKTEVPMERGGNESGNTNHFEGHVNWFVVGLWNSQCRKVMTLDECWRCWVSVMIKFEKATLSLATQYSSSFSLISTSDCNWTSFTWYSSPPLNFCGTFLAARSYSEPCSGRLYPWHRIRSVPVTLLITKDDETSIWEPRCHADVRCISSSIMSGSEYYAYMC